MTDLGEGSSGIQGEIREVASEARKSRNRLFFADNLRALMVILVILQHLAIAFGAPGDWYIEGKTDDMVATILFTLFNGVNETFFMAALFMLSGYFTPMSHDRKGGRVFLKDRLLRLGIPMMFYDIIITPIVLCIFVFAEGWFDGSVSKMLSTSIRGFEIGTGPLWFVQRLLVFSVIYVLWRLLAKPEFKAPQTDGKIPTRSATVVFALGLALATFVLRLWLPARTSIEFRGLEFPLIPPQWISFFIIGIIAYRRNWLVRIPDILARFWLVIVVANVFVFFPIVFALGGATEGDVSQFMGGFRWQALAYALWQQFVGMGMIIFLSALFRKHVNQRGRLARAVGASSYTAYIVHTPIAVLVVLAIRDINLYPLLQFAIAAAMAVPLCFLLGHLIRNLPLARRVL
jgi:surface polysaccharide O-acyltransferase-like enzyme